MVWNLRLLLRQVTGFHQGLSLNLRRCHRKIFHITGPSHCGRLRKCQFDLYTNGLTGLELAINMWESLTCFQRLTIKAFSRLSSPRHPHLVSCSQLCRTVQTAFLPSPSPHVDYGPILAKVFAINTQTLCQLFSSASSPLFMARWNEFANTIGQ